MNKLLILNFGQTTTAPMLANKKVIYTCPLTGIKIVHWKDDYYATTPIYGISHVTDFLGTLNLSQSLSEYDAFYLLGYCGSTKSNISAGDLVAPQNIWNCDFIDKYQSTHWQLRQKDIPLIKRLRNVYNVKMTQHTSSFGVFDIHSDHALYKNVRYNSLIDTIDVETIHCIKHLPKVKPIIPLFYCIDDPDHPISDNIDNDTWFCFLRSKLLEIVDDLESFHANISLYPCYEHISTFDDVHWLTRYFNIDINAGMSCIKNFLMQLYKLPYENISAFYNLGINNTIVRSNQQTVAEYQMFFLGSVCAGFVSLAGEYFDEMGIPWLPLIGDFKDKTRCHVAMKFYYNDMWYFIDPGRYTPIMPINGSRQFMPSHRCGYAELVEDKSNKKLIYNEYKNNNEFNYAIMFDNDQPVSRSIIPKIVHRGLHFPILQDIHITKKSNNGDLLEFYHGRFTIFSSDGSTIKQENIDKVDYASFIFDKYGVPIKYTEKAMLLREKYNG